MRNRIKLNAIKQLETVAFDSVYCSPHRRTWRWKLAENLYLFLKIKFKDSSKTS